MTCVDGRHNVLIYFMTTNNVQQAPPGNNHENTNKSGVLTAVTVDGVLLITILYATGYKSRAATTPEQTVPCQTAGANLPRHSYQGKET